MRPGPEVDATATQSLQARLWTAPPLPLARLWTAAEERLEWLVRATERTYAFLVAVAGAEAARRNGPAAALQALRGATAAGARGRVALGHRERALLALERLAPGCSGWNLEADLPEGADACRLASVRFGRRPAVKHVLKALVVLRNEAAHAREQPGACHAWLEALQALFLANRWLVPPDGADDKSLRLLVAVERRERVGDTPAARFLAIRSHGPTAYVQADRFIPDPRGVAHPGTVLVGYPEEGSAHPMHPWLVAKLLPARTAAPSGHGVDDVHLYALERVADEGGSWLDLQDGRSLGPADLASRGVAERFLRLDEATGPTPYAVAASPAPAHPDAPLPPAPNGGGEPGKGETAAPSPPLRALPSTEADRIEGPPARSFARPLIAALGVVALGGACLVTGLGAWWLATPDAPYDEAVRCAVALHQARDGSDVPALLTGRALRWGERLETFERRCGRLPERRILGCVEGLPVWRTVGGGSLADVLGRGVAAFHPDEGLFEIDFALDGTSPEELPALARRLSRLLDAPPQQGRGLSMYRWDLDGVRVRLGVGRRGAVRLEAFDVRRRLRYCADCAAAGRRDLPCDR